MHAGRGIRAHRLWWAGIGRLFQGLFKTLMLAAIVCAPPWAVADELTIVVMPMEHPRPECEPFDHHSFASRFPNLAIDNPVAEWQELRIGHHCWLCGELDKLADEAGEKIHLRFVGWEHALEDLTATYAGRYDVCQVPSTWTAYLIDKGLLASLEAFETNAYAVGALESCLGPDEHTYYAVPWHLDFRILYFRYTLTNDSQELVEFPKFRECLLRRQAAMKKQPGGVWQAPMGLGRTRDWEVLHNTLNWAFGGRILEVRDGRWRAVFHEGEPRDGLSKLWQLSQDNLVRFFVADIPHGEQEWQLLTEKLRQGEVDSVIGGPYMRVRFADQTDVLAAPLPRMVEGRDHTFLGGSHLGLTTAVQKRGKVELARKVVARLTSFEAGVALYQNTDAMPARKDAFEQFLTENPRWEAFGRALKSAQPYPSLPQWAEVIEKDKTLGDFHNVVLAIARTDDWDVVVAQITAAAEGINSRLPPPGPRWPERAWKWLFDHGMSLVLAAVLSAVVLVLVSLRRAVEKSKDKILNAMEDSAGKAVEDWSRVTKDLSELKASNTYVRGATNLIEECLADIQAVVNALGERAVSSDEFRTRADSLEELLDVVDAKVSEYLFTGSPG